MRSAGPCVSRLESERLEARLVGRAFGRTDVRVDRNRDVARCAQLGHDFGCGLPAKIRNLPPLADFSAALPVVDLSRSVHRRSPFLAAGRPIAVPWYSNYRRGRTLT